ncbi:hypothetical protein NUL63_004570 [Salmonella enterica]|nr:hypothetical protein [Salmonella enterica]
MSDYQKLIAQCQSALPHVPRQQIIEMLQKAQSDYERNAALLPTICPLNKSVAEGLDMEPKERDETDPIESAHRQRYFQNRVEKCLQDAIAKGFSAVQAADLRHQSHKLGKEPGADHEQIIGALEKHLKNCQRAE